MICGKRIVFLALAFWLFWCGGFAWGWSVAGFDSTPLGVSRVNSPTAGMATFNFGVDESTIGADYGYLNVVSGNSWLVQDVPLYLSPVIGEQMNYVWFYDLTSSVGTSSFYLDAVINDQPFGSSSPPTPDSDWLHASVTPDSFDWGWPDQAGEAGPSTPVAPPTSPPPTPDADAAVIEGYLRGGVADLKQFKDECGPTSTTNSLIWLAKKYGFTDKLPKKPDGTLDEAALVLELAKVMKPGWVPTDPPVGNNRGYPGLDRGELEAGKKKYIKDKKLPITVHGGVDDPKAQGKDTFEYVKKELKRGQDVEFLINWPTDGSHWVTVVGFIDAGKRNMLVVHDPLKANGNHYWEIDDDGKLTSPLGTANRAVAESIPEPATWILLITGLVMLTAGTRFRPAPGTKVRS